MSPDYIDDDPQERLYRSTCMDVMMVIEVNDNWKCKLQSLNICVMSVCLTQL